MLKAISIRTYAAVAFLGFVLWFPKDWEDQAQAWAVWARWLGVLNRETLLWVFSFGLLLWLIWTDVRPYIQNRWPKFSPKHAAIVQEIAGPLSEAEQIATDRLNAMARLAKEVALEKVMGFHSAQQKINLLTRQISYDRPTVETINDYLHLCSLIMHDELTDGDSSKERAELDQVRGPLFHALHAGKSINRGSLPLPQWMRERGTKSLRQR